MKSHTDTQRGITLLELMIGIAIAGILVTLAIPSFQDSIQRSRVKALTEEVYALVQFARSESIKQNTDLSFSIDVTNQCIGLDLEESSDTTDGCDCTTANDCNIGKVGTVEKVLNANDFPGAKISAGTTYVGAIYTPMRGTLSSFSGLLNANGTITIESTEKPSMQLSIKISKLGRPRVCYPSDVVTGYPGC
jgi:type IV fimbrial biogenesis protein FimT